MKKILLLNTLLWAAALPIFGQTVWNQLPLTGANAKIITLVRQPKFNIVFTGGFTLGDVSPQKIEFFQLQNAAFRPETAEQLFEKLIGQFFIGDPSNQKQNLEMTGRTQVMLGLRLGLRLGKRFELRAGGQYFKTKWSGEFTVFVLPHFPQEPTQPKTLQGNAKASASGFLAETNLAFFFTDGAVRPYMEVGVRGQFPTQNSSEADIAGVLFPLEVKSVATKFSPFGGAGLRWHFLKNGFLEAGATFGKLPGGNFQSALEAGVGWGF